MRVVFVAALASLLVACSSSGSPSSCVPGASVSCSCANGKTGAQVCASDGTLGSCSCDTGTGTGGNGSGTGGASGSGGTTGTGGSTGHGGASGTGGATSTGGATGTGGTGTGSGGTSGGSTHAQFTVTYDGSLTKTLSTCYSCTAAYTAATNTNGAAYNFTVDTGITSVSVVVRPAAGGGGNEVAAGLGENNPTVPATLQGTYATNPAYMPVGSSCVTFTTLTVGHGGGMAGSLNCTMSGGNDTTPHTAVVQGTFTATFP